KNQGRQPGWHEYDHGTITLRSQGTDEEAYPMARTFKCIKEHRNDIYIYTVVKASSDSDWQLTRAWETNGKGRFVREFPVAISNVLP
ncbi:MAG TPA: hypothetical protein VGR14_17590, partial [Verrucomicrobiae bacterium]|nr:hypothetical protein [Verrucomicrobiae bacterium]